MASSSSRNHSFVNQPCPLDALFPIALFPFALTLAYEYAFENLNSLTSPTRSSGLDVDRAPSGFERFKNEAMLVCCRLHDAVCISLHHVCISDRLFVKTRVGELVLKQREGAVQPLKLVLVLQS